MHFIGDGLGMGAAHFLKVHLSWLMVEMARLVGLRWSRAYGSQGELRGAGTHIHMGTRA